MINSGRRLALAIGVGAVLQLVLVAFSLHVGLWIDSVAGGCMRCYWALVGAYFTLGLAVGLGSVPWAAHRMRLTAAGAILLGGVIFGLLWHWGAPT